MRIELAKLILVGTRITYQATGDAGTWATIYHTKYVYNDILYTKYVYNDIYNDLLYSIPGTTFACFTGTSSSFDVLPLFIELK